MDLIWTPFEHSCLEQSRELTRVLNLPTGLAPLFCRNGLLDEAQARHFLSPRLKMLSDPFLLPDMRQAVDRILAALDRRERIVLYGDYDVDGVTSLAMLHRMLAAYGGTSDCFLPLRAEEGYGLSSEGLERCLAEHRPQLLVAVDCGTSSAREIANLSELGVDTVVIDHHETGGARPACAAIVNPKFGDEFHYLCSAGLVFKLCHALLKTRPLAAFELKDFLDLAALGTVADIVPLVGENRLIVRHGLLRLAQTRWAGLRALMQVSGVTPPLQTADIGYKLGPRLNAAGRLGTAQDALNLLLCNDPEEAARLAGSLNAQNVERQGIERRTHEEALQILEAGFLPGRDVAIVVGWRGWNSGVVGIVASRLQRKYHVPSVVVAFDQNGVGKGSGRSIAGFSLVAALSECGQFLEKSGGHEMAAGLTVHEENFPAFAARFSEVASRRLAGKDLRPRLHLAGALSLADLVGDWLEMHALFEPFGTGNLQPTFVLKGVHPVGEIRVLKDKHLRIDLRQNGATRPSIYFNGATGKLPPPPWDVAVQIEANTFRETTCLQISVQAIRTAVGN